MVRVSVPMWLLEAKKDRLPKNLRVTIEATVARETTVVRDVEFWG